MIVLFFVAYRLAFIKQGWTVYASVGVEMVLSLGMILYFGYVYFSLFLAFYIGNIQSKNGFITLYVVHLVTTITAVTLGFFIQSQMYFSQFPFIIITIIGVILLPVNLYTKNKREQLEGQLEDANKKIAELMVIEERERIARDLHDTLGQKLSLIGLKSDLAGKLVIRDPQAAKMEITDIHKTARTALKEVREMVSNMKNAKLSDEVIRVRQMLKAARIDLKLVGNTDLTNTPLLVENVVSMCLKESITNIVKHSQATQCEIHVEQTAGELCVKIKDNGVGTKGQPDLYSGNGLRGIRERLEFVNGSLEIVSTNGMTVLIKVPKAKSGL